MRPPAARPISTRDAALMAGIGAGSGVIDPTRTATDPAAVERIRQQNQGYAWDFASALVGRPSNKDPGQWWNPLNPNTGASWADLITGGKIPAKEIASPIAGVTIRRIANLPRGEFTRSREPSLSVSGITYQDYARQLRQRGTSPTGRQYPALPLGYNAYSPEGNLIGSLNTEFRRDQSGRPYVYVEGAHISPPYQNRGLYSAMAKEIFASGLPIVSNPISNKLIARYGELAAKNPRQFPFMFGKGRDPYYFYDNPGEIPAAMANLQTRITQRLRNSPERPTGLGALRMRYASGEIGRDEYFRLRDELSNG